MRWRLIAVLVGFTAIVLLVQNVPLAQYLRTVEYDRIVTGLQRDAFAIAGLAVERLEGEQGAITDAQLDKVVDQYATLTGAVVVIVDIDGTVIAASDDSVGESYANRPEIQEAIDNGRAVSGQRDSVKLGEPLLYVAVPVRASTTTNLGAVRLSYPVSAIDEVVNGRVRGLFIAAAITLLAAAIIAALVAAAVTRRIRRLRDAAEDIAEGDLAARADVTGSDEIAELADSFNTMADRVQHVVESQKGFAGDASHQLRTPLATLRLRLDRTAELLEEDDPAAEQVDAARDEIDRLGRLVDGLLMLARADGREQETVPVDISAVARDRVESWVPLAAERDVTLVLDSPGMAVAHAVPSAVEQIVDNYVDNALDVVPDGSRIVVTVRSSPDGVTLLVDDEGPGLSQEDRERAFDRFWRGRQDGGGSGLGLAVVASLAAAGGGSVWLAESPAGGVRACAKFRV
jgi:signal transduction histidine kinase